MENKKKRIVIALGGNTLGNTLPEQMIAVKITTKAIMDLIEEDREVIITHGNGPQMNMINNAMAVLSREDADQSNTPLSVCVTVNQAYVGYDLRSAPGGGLYNHEIYNIPVATMTTQIHVDAEDPASDTPNKPIRHFMIEEQVKVASEKYGYIMKEDAGRGCRCMVTSPKPAEIIETGATHSLVDSGQLIIACGGGGIPITRQGNHLKGANAVIGKDFASKLLAEELSVDFLIILVAVEKVAINFGKPEEKWLDNLIPDQTHVCIEEGHFAPGSVLPKVQAAVKLAKSKDGRTTLIILFEKAKERVQGLTGTHIHQ